MLLISRLFGVAMFAACLAVALGAATALDTVSGRKPLLAHLHDGHVSARNCPE